MQTINDVHQQFAAFFENDRFEPYAYLVSKKLAEGHICIDLKDLEAELATIPSPEEQGVGRTEHIVSSLEHEPLVGNSGDTNRPFILHNNRLYLQRYFSYETQILERIKKLLSIERRSQAAARSLIDKYGPFIRALFPSEPGPGKASGHDINWQLLAAVVAVLRQFAIITGGPGTGKTTTVAKILAILFRADPTLKVALAAPTGKAAVRMAESLKAASDKLPEDIKQKFESIKPSTIHRLLKPRSHAAYFQHDRKNPLDFNVVIVDESSMIDVALFSRLLDAAADDSKIILLGDKDQLASVEAGSLFGDLCKAQSSPSILDESFAILNTLMGKRGKKQEAFIPFEPETPIADHIVELKKSYRFNSEKGIGKLSKAVIHADLKGIASFLANKDPQVYIDKEHDEGVFNDFIKLYTNYINEPDTRQALKKLNTLRVLCAIRQGEYGVQMINKKIEKWLALHKHLRLTGEFYEHRPIMVTRNYYDLNLFNGDIGIIRTDENNVSKAWFEDSSGGVRPVAPGFLSEVETAFAMTIHKSQGSEYDQVLVSLPTSDIPLLTAELLYTAVSRAKTRVIVQSTEDILMQTSQRRVKRVSGIIERLSELENG